MTPANPNVFCALGYAHALGKPTILLARREAELTFDIQSLRVVFYNDTIGDKVEVERNLRRHLEATAARSSGRLDLRRAVCHSLWRRRPHLSSSGIIRRPDQGPAQVL